MGNQCGTTHLPLAVPEKLPLHFVRGCGYWIAPTGQIFEVETHIGFICDHPELFGLTSENVRRAFEEHGEVYRSEGTARRRLILHAVQEKNWIRVRHYRRGWTFNVGHSSDRRVSDFILAFTTLSDENVLLDYPSDCRRTTIADILSENSKMPYGC